MTIAVDFDGVLHAYSKGWQNGVIYDDPMPGAVEGLSALMERDAVFVFTARTNLDEVAAWIEKKFNVTTLIESLSCDSFWNQRDVVLVTNLKRPAWVYIDDRAVRFTSWDALFAHNGSLLLPGIAAFMHSS